MRILYAIPILLLAACSNVSQNAQETVASTTNPIASQDSIITTPEKPTEAVSEPVIPSTDKSFTSAQEAYDEGHCNGQQEGYTDATHHLDYGYNYNDEPEYSGFLKSYMEGYEDGYDDGWNEGQEWNSEND